MKGNLLVTTTPSVENATVAKYLGVVSTNIVIGTNVFSDIIASFSDFLVAILVDINQNWN